MVIKDNKLWKKVDSLCWEGFSKVMKYSNNDIDKFVTGFKGDYSDWCNLIDNITSFKGDSNG